MPETSHELKMKISKFLRSTFLILACALPMSIAHAQRRGILIAELVDVPVSIATSAKPTRDQVQNAIIAAALASEWDVETQPDGALRLSMTRDYEIRVAVSVPFTDTHYSIYYLSSESLKYFEMGDRGTAVIPLETYMADWRSNRSAKQPEFKYAQDRPGPIIHPAYENYVYELSASIRRHLRWALR